MGNYFVKIRAKTLERIRKLQRVHDLDVFRHTAKQRADGEYEIQGLLSDEQVDKIRMERYEVEVSADAEAVAKERLKEIKGPSPGSQGEMDKKQHPDG